MPFICTEYGWNTIHIQYGWNATHVIPNIVGVPFIPNIVGMAFMSCCHAAKHDMFRCASTVGHGAAQLNLGEIESIITLTIIWREYTGLFLSFSYDRAGCGSCFHVFFVCLPHNYGGA